MKPNALNHHLMRLLGCFAPKGYANVPQPNLQILMRLLGFVPQPNLQICGDLPTPPYGHPSWEGIFHTIPYPLIPIP
jgi:hypothetical protein